jgi:hypothetical protein
MDFLRNQNRDTARNSFPAPEEALPPCTHYQQSALAGFVLQLLAGRTLREWIFYCHRKLRVIAKNCYFVIVPRLLVTKI